MLLPLPSHVHFASVGEDIVFLDVERDAYYCVPDGVAALRPTADRRWLAPRTPDLAGELVDAGLALPGVSGPAADFSQVLALPARGLPPGPAGLSVRERLRLAGALWDLVTRYARRDLAHVLAVTAAAGKRPLRGDGEAETLRLARAFERSVIWLPVPRKCVVRSFLLLRFLQRSGRNAAWVFGVRTWPFGAHCWLQWRDIALDDAPERLQTYEPILAGGR